MQKQTKKSKSPYDVSSSLSSRLGAWVLTAAALLASTEMLHQTDHAAVPVPVGAGQNNHSLNEGMLARAEGSRETARLPEEYDVGLRMPAISGS